MKKKKLISLLTAVVLLGAVGVGATLAYFTDSEEKVNIVTMGHVDIELDEPNYEGDENNEIKDLTPGQTIVKDPTITLRDGSADAYVRATLEVTGYENITDAEGNIVVIDELDIHLMDGWYLNEEDGYYYYNERLTEGDQAVLFDYVVIPVTWGNEVSGCSFKIIVSAEAIQADNFEPVRNENGNITAWLYQDGTAITAENYVAPDAR